MRKEIIAKRYLGYSIWILYSKLIIVQVTIKQKFLKHNNLCERYYYFTNIYTGYTYEHIKCCFYIDLCIRDKRRLNLIWYIIYLVFSSEIMLKINNCTVENKRTKEEFCQEKIYTFFYKQQFLGRSPSCIACNLCLNLLSYQPKVA